MSPAENKTSGQQTLKINSNEYGSVKSSTVILFKAPPRSSCISMPATKLLSAIITTLVNFACLAKDTNFEDPPISFSKISEQTIVLALYPTRSIPRKSGFELSDPAFITVTSLFSSKSHKLFAIFKLF